MNYEYYRTFYYVGKNKSLTRAAEELYTSQPAVTHAIKRLEEDLKCKLFIRKKTGVEFTHEGEALFHYVSMAHNQLEKGEKEISATGDGTSGTIYIAATVTSLHCFLFSFLNEFNAHYPEVKFKITTSSNNGCIERLKAGTVDLAFVTTPFQFSKGLKVHALINFPDILVAGRKYEDLKEKTLTYGELNDHPLVLLSPKMQLRKFIDSEMENRNLVLTPDIELDSSDLLLPMIRNNFGLGFIPEPMARDALEKGDVLALKTSEAMPERKVIMTYDTNHYLTSTAKRLIEMVLHTT